MRVKERRGGEANGAEKSVGMMEQGQGERHHCFYRLLYRRSSETKGEKVRSELS